MADRFHRQSSTASRRTLERRPSAASSLRSQQDVFSDENIYDADDLMVADGFQPTNTGRVEPPPTSTTPTPTPPRPQGPSRSSTRRQQPPPPRPSEDSKPQLRSSIAKTGLGTGGTTRNEFALRHDTNEAPQRTASTRTEMSQRPNSMISMFSLPPSQSPYMGASGPSHPYGMYPQDTSLNRSSTVISARPTHPYGMYPQSTAIDADPLASSTDIATVGFPGLGRTYARRLGPDGEDADDIIGPDGHTEQLPPYTRYPDGNPQINERYAPSTGAVPSSPSIHTTEETTTTTATTATQQATSSSEERLLAEDSEANGEAINPDGTQPKWAQHGKRRFFGGRVPAWFICLSMFVLIALAATVGGVIGHSMAFMHNHNQFHNNQQSFGNPTSAADSFPTSFPTSIISITTTLIDATPAATPGHLPQLPAGEFNFELDAPTDAANNCVTNPGQAGAGVWGCTDDGTMSFGVQPSDVHATMVYLSGMPIHGLTYGPQPPTMPGPIGLSLMTDTEQPGLGPAFFFQTAYTKQVIIPEHALNTSLARRGLLDSIARSLHTRDNHVNSGDNPWFCFWNNTLLEGFIYVQAPPGGVSNLSAPASSSSAGTSTSPAPPPPTRLRERDHDGHGDGMSQFWHHLHDMEENAAAPYPYPMKFEERRTPANPIKPYCQQMTVGDNMGISPKLNNGQPIMIPIDEKDPVIQEQIDIPGGPLLKRRGDATAKRDTGANGCVCQWMT